MIDLGFGLLGPVKRALLTALVMRVQPMWEVPAIDVWPNPLLPWEVPAGARSRLWDESFAPIWDSHPPAVTPELDSDGWARWHTRAPGGRWISPDRVSAVSAWSGQMIESAAPAGAVLEEG